MGGEHDARPDMLSFRTTRHSRGAVLAVAAVLICLLLALHRSATAKAKVDACDTTEADFSVLSRHARRRRRRELLTQVGAFDFARFWSPSALRSAASLISGSAESAAGEGRARFFVDMGSVNVADTWAEVF